MRVDQGGRSRQTYGPAIDGVQLHPLTVHEDDRGSFAEVYASHWDLCIEPEQWSIVRSRAGALRGMHLHHRHDEYLQVVSGHLSVGLHDLRAGSPTEGCSALFELTEGEPVCLAFPRGLVHGWVAHRPTVHLQGVSEAYATYGADDNDGCRWDDPELALPWPVTPTRVSQRSAGFGSLADLRATRDRSLVTGPPG